jgi:hypothetical protein
LYYDLLGKALRSSRTPLLPLLASGSQLVRLVYAREEFHIVMS